MSGLVHDTTKVHDTSRAHDTTRVHDTTRLHDTQRVHQTSDRDDEASFIPWLPPPSAFAQREPSSTAILPAPRAVADLEPPPVVQPSIRHDVARAPQRRRTPVAVVVALLFLGSGAWALTIGEAPRPDVDSGRQLRGGPVAAPPAPGVRSSEPDRPAVEHDAESVFALGAPEEQAPSEDADEKSSAPPPAPATAAAKQSPAGAQPEADPLLDGLDLSPSAEAATATTPEQLSVVARPPAVLPEASALPVAPPDGTRPEPQPAPTPPTQPLPTLPAPLPPLSPTPSPTPSPPGPPSIPPAQDLLDLVLELPRAIVGLVDDVRGDERKSQPACAGLVCIGE